MKNKIFIIVSLLILLASCAPGAHAPLEDHLLAYNWKITYMKHANVDETPTFALYTFNFEGNEVVHAIRPDSTFHGTWYRTNASQDNPKVLLDFGGHFQLFMLLHDWQQENRTDHIIQLVDNMAASGDAAVTFERIP